MTETKSDLDPRTGPGSYLRLFEDAPDGYLITDPESRILLMNRTAEELLGSRRGLLGSKLVSLTESGYRPVFEARLQALASGRTTRVQDWHVRLMPPGSRNFDAELTVVPSLANGRESEGFSSEPTDSEPAESNDSAGHLTLRWLLRDVTERRRAESSLRQGMVHLRAILESAVDGIIAIDAHGKIELFNPSAERLFGYHAEEVMGQNVKVLMPNPYHDAHDGYLETYKRTGERKIIGIGREVVGRRKNGSTFPMDLAVSEIRLTDERSFVGIVRDITERKEIEKALRRERDFAESLVETAQAIVLLLDPEGRILRYNRYMENISGIPLDEARGRSWFETFLPPEDHPAIRQLFDRALDGTPTRGNINPILTRSGEIKDIEWFDTQILDPEGNVTGLLAIGQDLTPRKKLEEQIRRAQKLEAIGRLAGGVAHDFNTLLGSIRGYSELLLDEVGSDSSLELPARHIHEAAERGAALTSQLLAFSRQQVLQPKVFDLNSIVERMDGLLERLIRADICLVRNLHPEPLPVEVDANQIEQVIMNLVVNACDAMPTGGTITLSTYRSESAPDAEAEGTDDDGAIPFPRAYLRVADTGTGMDEGVRRQLFDPFFTTKDAGKGTGLGLSTVYGIVTQSRGSIGVESTLGEGSTFLVSLPLTGEPLTPEPKPTTTRPKPRSGTELILLVEDDPMFRGLLEQVLRSRGYRVLAAEDAPMALQLCEGSEGDPDLLVSDMVMPGGMSGSELATKLREQYPRLAVLLMSGYTDEDIAERIDASGLGHEARFLEKPFGTHEFADEVRSLLDRRAD